MMTSTLDAALAYAKQGYAVFPCNADKSPRTAHGFEDATTDEAAISEQWGDAPCIGLAIPEGVVVIDVDPRNGGDETMNALRAEHGRGAFPSTKQARTGSGGSHRWYRVPADLKTRAHLGKGVDVKRHGKGYIIVPPSVSTGGEYTWTAQRTPAHAPPWLLDAIAKPERNGMADSLDRLGLELPPYLDGTAYGLRALQLELEKLRAAAPGERNDALNQAAFAMGQLIAGGELRESFAMPELWAAAMDLGLGEHETELTLNSGLNAGLLEPRNAPELADQANMLGGTAARLTEARTAQDEAPGFWLDWTGEPEPVEFILDPVLPTAAYVLVYGPTEASKSMVFNLIGAEASCRGWTVSVYSLENPPNVDRARLHRMNPCTDNFRLSNQLLNLADPLQAQAMARRERGRDLVIIDTYSHAFAQRFDSGDGNAKAIEFARVIRWLIAETGATFLVIDHTGFERREEPRDASAKRQQVDIAIGMERIGEWRRGQPSRWRMHNYKSARFANPFDTAGSVTGDDDEPLLLEIDDPTVRFMEKDEPTTA